MKQNANTLKDAATDYWLENTTRIYAEDLHVSTPVIEAFEAGAKWAIEQAENKFDEYKNGHNQTFNGGANDSVDLTLRVMWIIRDTIRSALGECK
jgi:hypothetical protein